MMTELEKLALVNLNGDYRPFYKYRNFRNEYHVPSLAQSKLWFAGPLSFNDPFDCQIPAEYISKDQDAHRKYIAYLARKKGCPESQLAQVVEECMNDPETNPRDETKRWEKNYAVQREVLERVVSIFSVSRNVKSVLMWSHYVDNHRGFVIGYNAENLIDSIGDVTKSNLIMKPVSYTLSMPTPVNREDFGSIAGILSAKNEDWRYEEEYRFIHFRQDSTVPGVEIIIPSSVIESITFGLDTPRKDETRLRESISHWPEQPKFYRMKRRPYSFELEIEPA